MPGTKSCLDDNSALRQNKILEGLLKLPENRECADCKAKYLSQIKTDDMGLNFAKFDSMDRIMFTTM
ncbi:hypothetical protein RJ640_004536, partial [Escallonia rubra]